MIKRLYFTILNCVIVLSLWAVEVHIADPKSWTNADLAPYLDLTVTFDVPMFLLYESNASLSPCCLPGANYVVLNNYPKSKRDRTYSRDVKATVKKSNQGNYYLDYVSGTFDGNTRETLKKGPDSLQIDALGKHTLLVCGANLQYYIKTNFQTNVGPKNSAQHERQRTKTRQGLAAVNADIYGLCEVEQLDGTLLEICSDLNAAHPDRNYTYISVASQTIGVGFVYDTKVVRTIGSYKAINTELSNRKYMQCFEELATKETFILSMNHFKAMSGGGDTESRRIAEAKAVNSSYDSYKVYCGDEDLLIMGDLNCYYGTEPITILLQDGERTDLHRKFHPEGSYSYVYNSEPSYLDHAIVNSTLLPQVTGMQAMHINSDEDNRYAYNGQWNDGTMFRYSDHDPILVGLRLDSKTPSGLRIINCGPNLLIQNAEGGYVRIYDMSGNLIYSHVIDRAGFGVIPEEAVPAMRHGCYLVHVFYNGKNNVTKYLRP